MRPVASNAMLLRSAIENCGEEPDSGVRMRCFTVSGVIESIISQNKTIVLKILFNERFAS